MTSSKPRRLASLRKPVERFARSINIERDTGSGALASYLPMGRAVDAVHRLASTLSSSRVERAISVTGPYGSGKSSFAVLVDGLLRPADDDARRVADELLSTAAPAVFEAMAAARIKLNADRTGFVRCLATAEREPVIATVLRALETGAESFSAAGAHQLRAMEKVRASICAMQTQMQNAGQQPSVRQVRELVKQLSAVAPVLLLIDEFGKNLEAFADSRSAADLFLLQELAEWSRNDDETRLVIVTMQHLAFDEYAEGASGAQRREWAKVQGRFEDIPFVDSAASTRALIAAAFVSDEDSNSFADALDRWSSESVRTARRLGLAEIADEGLVRACWPLHPLALLALPDLCQRYGQNERTLFSFLAGTDSNSLATWLRETAFPNDGSLPCVRVDDVYDFFVDSTATLGSAAHSASRWVEIDTRIRDVQGLTKAQRRVLKTVGLLNLVSTGGTLRASKDVVAWAAADGELGTESTADVLACLEEMEASGLLTWRDFADELRVWQGSDVDLRDAIDLARRRLHSTSAAQLLERIRPLPPLIAARHSHHFGTLRSFTRHWVDEQTERLGVPGAAHSADGVAYYVLDKTFTTSIEHSQDERRKPVVVVTVADGQPIKNAALEVAAMAEALASDERVKQDWVARAELVERHAEALSALDAVLEDTFGAAAADRSQWHLLEADESLTPIPARGGSMALSWVADRTYDSAPVVRNDILNRHQLSSAGAKARRELIEAMLTKRAEQELGIHGFGPEMAMYRAILKDSGIHWLRSGHWGFSAPPKDSSYAPVWNHLVEAFESAKQARIVVGELLSSLGLPPFGLRAGISPVLFTAALIANADQVALYEHGTFRPALTPELFERLLRNPERFQVKHFGTRRGARRDLLDLSVSLLPGPMVGRDRAGSVLAVVSRLVQSVNTLPEHVKKTKLLSQGARGVRAAILSATEPDDLLFGAIPAALGLPAVPVTGSYSGPDVQALLNGLADAMRELTEAYPAVLREIVTVLGEALGAPDRRQVRSNVAERAQMLAGKVVDPDVRRLITALTADIDSDDSWAEYVGLQVTNVEPAAWTDEDRTAFRARATTLGGTFRRLEALNYERRAREDDGFDAFRVTVTRPDGQESATVVWAAKADRERLVEIVEASLRDVERVAGSRAGARDLLLALLAEDRPTEDRRTEAIASHNEHRGTTERRMSR